MRSNSSNKESILAITFLLLLLFIYFRNINIVYAALAFIFAALVSETVAGFFHQLWKKLTEVLGLISSTIILSVLFYCIVFPWGLMLKLMNRNPLILSSKIKTTTFTSRNKLFTHKDLQNPY